MPTLQLSRSLRLWLAVAVAALAMRVTLDEAFA
jgi:hypothetical protein